MTGDSYDCGKNGLYAGVREVWATELEGRGEVQGKHQILALLSIT